MRAGSLDQRVTIERRIQGQDVFGQPIDSWEPLATVWAAVEPLQGREFIAAMAVQSEISARIRMRYRPYLTAQDRIVHQGKTYGIESVIDVKSAAREMHLMCKRVG